MRFWIQPVRRVGMGAVLGVILLATPGLALAAATAGGASLQIPPGARAEGMGRFFNAVADDAFAPWWNPAGLAFMRGWNAGLMHATLVPGLATDVYYEYLGVSNYLAGWGGVAGTLTYLNYGTSEATLESTESLGTFSSFEVSPSVALGTAVLPNLGVGINLKLFHVNLAPEEFASGGSGKGTTFSVDLGTLYRWNKEVDSFFGSGPAQMEAGFGVTVSNLGPDISLVDELESDPMPRNLKIGFSLGAKVPESYSVLFGLAVEKSLVFETIPDSISQQLSFYDRNEVLVSGGFEFGIVDMAFARIGYLYDDPGEIKGPTFGAGFHLKQFGFDFASIPQFRELNRVSKFSIIARFD